MLSQRSTHYWLWFLLFGLVSAAVAWSRVHGLDAESTWLLVSGFLGLVFGSRLLGRSFSRPYDLIIGLLFFGVGILGVLHNFGINLVVHNPSVPPGAVDSTSVLGLSLSLPYALIHSVLGLTSLNHGLKPKAVAPAVTVGATPMAA